MGKTYLDIVKYMVEAKFNIDGLVDKPDIIGAVFGQTEGLLGDELDLRELQKNGKIGRIEIDVSQSGSKTYGRLFLPASLDRVETCILAAAVESVDRVGPYEAQFSVGKVEDTRSEKRRKILDRAKELVKNLLNTGMPDSRELAELVQSEVKASEITTYGVEKLPAGPDIAKSNELIIVEGRADVLNLIRNDITNVIAIGGATTVPKAIIDLANEKEITVFLDGDRGGDLILKGITNAIEIDFVAKAPDGKEVEELARKEIIKALRTRAPVDQYLGGKFASSQQRTRPQPTEKPSPQMPQMNQRMPPRAAPIPTPMPSAPDDFNQGQSYGPVSTHKRQQPELSDIDDLNLPKIGDEDDSPRISKIVSGSISEKDSLPPTKPALESIALSQLPTGLDELAGSLRSRLYDNGGNIVREMPIRELLNTVQDSENVYAIVLDGVITQRLVELAMQKGIRAVYGLRANPLPKKPEGIILYTKEQGRL